MFRHPSGQASVPLIRGLSAPVSKHTSANVVNASMGVLMRRSFKHLVQALIFAAAIALIALAPSQAAEKKDFKVAWSIYVGWMPWGYAQSRAS